MKVDYKRTGMRTLVVLAFVLVLGILYGCSKTEPAKVDTAATQAANQASEQTTCPMCGKPIDKNLYTVYQGKKVYFCNEGCKKEFEESPEKFSNKLPQSIK